MDIIVHASVMTASTAGTSVMGAYITVGEMMALAVPMERVNDRFPEDTVTVGDAFTMLFSLPRADTVTAVDALVKLVTKPFAETLTAVDSFSRVVTWSRPFAETLTATDVNTRSWTKNFADTVSVVEVFTINGQNNPSDLVSTADAATRGVGKSVTGDTATATDSGEAVVQDYFASGTYFESDYFGTGRTF